ncbi:MAG: transglycosylase domain-containing protein [Actinobacteria bacterium]|nr:transglycosylase domain-containing protein [Actinomycetota bacterium]
MSRKSRKAKGKSPKAKVRHRSWAQRLLLRYGWLLPVMAVFVGTGILLLTYAFASIPLPRDVVLPSSAEVYDVHGKMIGTFTDEVTRFIIDTRKLPDYVGEAVVASEDRDFYSHGGVSLRGIVRAGWANMTGGEIQQGGSTITQQYVKQAVLQDTSRTLTRKVKEAILAIKLERRHSKREILDFYLNTVYFGRGAYGIEAAARAYFDTTAEELSLKQSAYLAGVIPAPERYQPDDNQLGARERRDRTLRLMAEEGYITDQRADKAARGKVKLEGDQRTVKRSRAAYFMEWLRKEFLYKEKYYGADLYQAGLKIYTTLDLEMQEQAEEAVSSVLTEKGDPQAALVSMTPRGEVRAMVGSRTDFTNVTKARGFNYATDSPGRHAGSAFKPFTLATALDEGISTSSTFSGRSPAFIDETECMGDEDNDGDLDPWEVENFGGSSYGSMNLDQATTNSVNTVYAQLIAEVGAEKVRDIVEQFGFAPKFGEEEISANCSLALGTQDVTPLEMARAYAGFAARGRLPKVMPIRYVVDSAGNCRAFLPDIDEDECDAEAPEYQGEQVIDRNTADVLNQTLTHVVQSGTATAANIGRPVAGKTGTTQDFESAWFAGHTPNLVTVVWEGYPIETIKAEPGSYVDVYGPVPKSGKIAIKPRMTSCADPRVCRLVHGYEITGGGTPFSPVVMWANYMREAVAELDPLPFPVPTETPDEVLNSPAPEAPGDYAPVDPAPEETEEPEEPEPTTEPTKEPEPEPTAEPTVVPTGTPGGDGGDGGSGDGGDP